jgi:hypothetical protein
MGDTAVTDPVADLIIQVNRFGPAAPVGLQFVQQPFPLATGISPELALAALTIYQRRSTDAFNQFHDAGSAAAIAAANLGFINPVAFVTGALADVTRTIAGYADSIGLPNADGTSSTIAGIDLQTVLIVAGLGVAAWWLVK